jgi:hypothetical protein
MFICSYPARWSGCLTTALALSLLPAPGRAQSRLSFAAGVGAGIALDRLHAPDGLPPKVRQLRRLRGPMVSLGARYLLGPHWQLAADVRGAGLVQGFKITHQVLQRDASGQETAWADQQSWLSYNRPHLTGGLRYLLGLPGQKLRLEPELGAGYMVDASYYDQEWPQTVGFGGPDYPPEEEIRARLSRILVRRGNWGSYAALNAHYRLSPHSALELNLYCYRGLRVMSELRADYFQYINRRDNVYRDYRVSISSRGSYVAAKATYCYTL